MTFGQLVLYYNYGVELQFGKSKPITEKKTSELSAPELAAEKERLRRQYGDPAVED